MSLSEKDIDKLFQHMDEKASLDYKDAYWTEMEQLLNTQQRKRGFVWWLNGWLLIPAGLLLATVTAMGFSMRKSTTPNQIVRNESVIVDTEGLNQNNNSHLANLQLNNSDETLNLYSNTIKQQVPVGEIIDNSYVKKDPSNSKIKLLVTTPKSKNNREIVDNSKNLENETLDLTVVSSDITDLESDTTNLQHNSILQKDEITQTSVENNNSSIIDKDLKHKNKWRMYIGGGLGMSSNLQTPKTHHGAAIVRLEYGVSKAFNRFSFSTAFAIENTFGNSLALENKYVSYGLKRNDNKQEYTYNRFTNFMIPIRMGYFVGKNQRSHIQIVAMPAYTMYNNLVYKEFSNGNFVAKDEYFNQDVGLNRFFVNLGIGYEFMITKKCSLGFEYNNNFGLNRKKSLSSAYSNKSDHQFIIQLRYFIR